MGNSGGVYTWSKVAANNATADNTVNYAEGQAPSSLNDSARAAMTSVAKWRDDISGAIVTTGTSTAYIVSSNQFFDTVADANGQVIAFSPHATNGTGPVTLNVDGLGAKPLRSAPNAELLAGVLIQGTPYLATYNNSDGAFYLQGFYGNPYNVPLLGAMDFWDTITPNSSFIFPAGQAISRVTYATTFARWGTTYGAGDGSTTFNVPDKTGRVSAMIESVASRLTAGFFGTSTAMGSTGGLDHSPIGTTNLPASPLAVTGTTSGYTPTVGGLPANGVPNGATQLNFATSGPGATFPAPDFGNITGFASLSVTGTTPNMGSGIPIPNVPPLIICNYIIRII